MQLREVLGDAARDAPPVEVTALAYDNRLVTSGTLFFCVPGFTRDGHDFAPDAVARGAVALVVQRPLGLGVPEIVVDGDLTIGRLAGCVRSSEEQNGEGTRRSGRCVPLLPEVVSGRPS